MSESGPEDEKDEVDVHAELEKLRRQNAELVEKLREIEREAKATRETLLKWGGRVTIFAVKVFLGRDLAESMEEWREAKTLSDPLPAPQTSNLVAAVFARVLRVSLIGFAFALVLALAPHSVTIWQNILVQRQLEQGAEQIQQGQAQLQQGQAQLRQGAVHDFRARRAQLLRTIYDRRECWADEEPVSDDEEPAKIEQPGCPAASIQARAAAAVTLVQIERAVNESPDDWPGLAVQKVVDLGEADLRGANLWGADLSGAHLGTADLRRANLSFASLNGVILRGADLRGASLVWARMNEALLIGANMQEARLSEVYLSEAKFSSCDLRGATLSGAFLQWAKLYGTDLRGADLRGANLDGAKLSGGVDLRGATLDRANLSGAELGEVDLRGVDLGTTILDGCEYCPPETEQPTLWPEGFAPENCIARSPESCSGS